MVKLTKNYLAEIKKRLINYRQSLEKELAKIGKKGKRGYRPSFPKYGRQEDENILEIEDFAENVSIEEKLNRLLDETKQAIKRIKEDKYGQCQKCGRTIKAGRLKIYPIATSCVSCAKKEQAKNQRKSFWRKMWPFSR